MWWWGEQELPGLQAYVDDSVKSYTTATVKPMLQDTAVVISQFQTAAAAGQPPDIQFLWNGIYHMASAASVLIQAPRMPRQIAKAAITALTTASAARTDQGRKGEKSKVISLS